MDQYQAANQPDKGDMADHNGPDEEPLRCLDDRNDGTCQGTVYYFTLDGLQSWPRCSKHFDERMERRENSIEKYANSDIAPSWFDPSAAGESWDEY